ncbi:MAG: PucR family transcriptional regulator [Clostridiales bacterium]|nr:PucR family transcriptional regulator [Clostridiales bacterium]
MSVTVSDLLNLPSLKQAKVIAGKKGLNKIVSSISVLESVNPSVLVDGLFQQGEFFGSEIVITGFLNCPDDVDCQCANIKRLAEGGEIGLILFYVGIYVPCVDKKLIDLANEMNFVLIQMPKSKDLRYGEVINDVTEHLFNDRSKNEFIVSDILARVSMLPEHQRSINTVLRMVSDGVMSSVILTDSSMNLLNLAAWPQNIEENIKDNLQSIYGAANAEDPASNLLPDAHTYSFSIFPDNELPMKLFLVKEGVPLSQMLQEQVADIVRICVNIWGESHSNVAIRELIRAILQDDPIKMHRLAELFHVNTSDIHDMWILSGELESSPKTLQEKLDLICDYMNVCSNIVFADVYEDKLLIFASTPDSEKEAEKQVLSILSEIKPFDATVTLSKFSNLQNTTDVRKAYLCHKDNLTDAKKIFPTRTWFSAGNIEFSQECHSLIDKGEDAISHYTSIFKSLQQRNDDWNAVDTLGVYMFDADCSITTASELLHVHKNTVKYRLKVIDNHLGYSHDKMPDNMKMYYAIALYRLLS